MKSKRCPSTYFPSADVRHWAATKFPTVPFEEALEAMRDWEFKTPRSDWDAVLRTWIRTEAKRSTTGRLQPSASEPRMLRTKADFEAFRQRIAAEEAASHDTQ